MAAARELFRYADDSWRKGVLQIHCRKSRAPRFSTRWRQAGRQLEILRVFLTPRAMV